MDHHFRAKTPLAPRPPEEDLVFMYLDLEVREDFGVIACTVVVDVRFGRYDWERRRGKAWDKTAIGVIILSSNQ